MGGPSTKSQRNKALFGNVGREGKPQQQQGAGHPLGGGEGQRPRVRRDSSRQGPVDLGASGKEVDSMIIRRKSTRRIPKKDGTGFEGDAAPLDSMGSGRRPQVGQQQPRQRHVDPGPQSSDVPPVVNMPVPQSNFKKQDQGPPTSKGNTLAGVSAEDLLGEEGKQLLENMRKRETEQKPPAEQQGGMFVESGQQQRPGTPLNPRAQDSSRQQFQSAEYAADSAMDEVAPSDELAPQDSFLSGPTKRMERDVLQTPMPAEQPPSDDLGYERPVDFGDAQPQQAAAPAVNDEEPVARESAAHDEMEQRAGYLLWLQGVITREEVEDAMVSADDVSEPIQDLLADSTFTDQVTLYRFLARHESLAPVDLTQVEPSERALAALRPSIARAYRVVPLEKIGELLLVAASFPFDPKRLLELRRLTASKVKLYIATEEEIDVALLKYYPGGTATLRSPKPEGIDKAEETEAADESNITGEGEALVNNYDPTLSGEDSGLYAPVDGPVDDAPSDIALAEVDEGTDVNDTLDEVAEDGDDDEAGIGDTDDLDESTLARGGAVDLDDDDELSLGGDDDADDGTKLDSGPEDLDPFAD